MQKYYSLPIRKKKRIALHGEQSLTGQLALRSGSYLTLLVGADARRL
jgi:hypothetical protein